MVRNREGLCGHERCRSWLCAVERRRPRWEWLTRRPKGQCARFVRVELAVLTDWWPPGCDASAALTCHAAAAFRPPCSVDCELGDDAIGLAGRYPCVCGVHVRCSEVCAPRRNASGSYLADDRRCQVAGCGLAAARGARWLVRSARLGWGREKRAHSPSASGTVLEVGLVGPTGGHEPFDAASSADEAAIHEADRVPPWGRARHPYFRAADRG